jgi:hypothetical protein
MTQDRGLRRFRPCLENLEPRDLPSTLQIVGPNPNDRGARGPFLNLIVVKDSSRAGPAGAHRAHRARGHATPAHPLRQLGPGGEIVALRGLLNDSGVQGHAGKKTTRRLDP